MGTSWKSLMRRHWLAVVVLLMVGAVVNVGVAWGCAALADYSRATEQIIITTAWDQGGYIMVGKRTLFGFTQSIQRLVTPNSYGGGGYDYTIELPTEGHNDEVALLRPGETLERARPDIFKRLKSGEYPTGTAAIWPWQTLAGWPMRSMTCWHENLMAVPSAHITSSLGPVTITRGMQIDTPTWESTAHVLPFQPLWAGFAVNTVFYAGIFGAVLWGAREVRARGRVRRGLCRACAYPIGTSAVCTECGAGVRR